MVTDFWPVERFDQDLHKTAVRVLKYTPLRPHVWPDFDDARELCGKLPNLGINLKQFAGFLGQLDFRQSVPVRAEKGEIFGWALTSTRGSNIRGVNSISRKIIKSQLVYPTRSCFGYVEELIHKLGLQGFFASRARILALGPSAEMKFSRDLMDTRNPFAYGLYCPVIASASAEVQWLVEREIVSKSFASDGSSYLINVGEPHRIVNRSKRETQFHFICSLI